MNNKTIKDIILIPATIFIIVVLILYIIVMINYNHKFLNEKINNEKIKTEKYLEIGKSVGRNSIILYLNRTKQMNDTVSIDIKDLLFIEDSIQNNMLNECSKCNVN